MGMFLKRYLRAKFVMLLLCGTAAAVSITPTATQNLAQAIAKAEGYYTPRTIPARCNNPGDLKSVRGWKYPGQIGVCRGSHVKFATPAAGWAALYHQIDKIVNGQSRHYSVDMTLQQVARKYAGNSRVWARNVAHNLGVPANTTLAELLEVPPPIVAAPSHELDALFLPARPKPHTVWYGRDYVRYL